MAKVCPLLHILDIFIWIQLIFSHTFPLANDWLAMISVLMVLKGNCLKEILLAHLDLLNFIEKIDYIFWTILSWNLEFILMWLWKILANHFHLLLERLANQPPSHKECIQHSTYRQHDHILFLKQSQVLYNIYFKHRKIRLSNLHN